MLKEAAEQVRDVPYYGRAVLLVGTAVRYGGVSMVRDGQYGTAKCSFSLVDYSWIYTVLCQFTKF